jgi:stalled ribosome rescue protein Dom34
VRRALEAGQVDTLVLDDQHATNEAERAELVRLATNTGARVEVVSGNSAMEPFAGIGAILRYAVRQK